MMITWLLFPAVTEAASLSLVLGASFTLTGADGALRPGGALSLATQVMPVRDYGWPAQPTVGLVAHRRWLAGGHRRWLLGARFGATALFTGGYGFHNDFVSAEAELGLRVSGERDPAGYVGAHVTAPLVLGAGFDSELVPSDDPHATAYVSLQLPIPPVLEMEGRAFRVPGGQRLPLAIPAAGADAAWIRRGRDELASVATFSRLAAELRALRAPSGLVERARQAAREEFGHARACFALAGGALAAPLRWTPRSFPSPEAARRVLGAESLLDGAQNESEAAAQFQRRALYARTPATAAVLRRIAREERQHAALGYDIARWCGVVSRATVVGPGARSPQSARLMTQVG